LVVVHAVKGEAKFRRAQKDETGAVLVIVALSITVIMGFAALVIDGGNARQAQRQGQAAADAAALAGAHVLSEGGSAATAESTAGKYITAYGYKSVTDSPPADGTQKGNANCVEVITSQVQPQRFSQVEKVGPITVAGRAVACANNGSSGKFGLITLDPSACKSFDNSARLTLNLYNGTGVFVNSSCPMTASSAAYYNNGTVTATPPTSTFDVVGGQIGGCGSGCTVTTGATQPSPVDPLASTTVPPPLPTGLSPTPCSQTSGTFQPGIYNCQLTISDSATFEPGDYLITGGLVIQANKGTITFGAATGVSTYFTLEGVGYQDNSAKKVTITSFSATGVLIYLTNITSAPTCNGGAWETTGNGDAYSLYPPLSGTDAGISIYVDPSVAACYQSPAVLYTGNGSGAGISGTVYAPKGEVEVTANGGTDTVGGIVADTVFINGSTDLTLSGGGYSLNGTPFVSLAE
jgi:hypothetical protein